MPEEGSVTGWLDQLRGGDAGAAEQLWSRYFSSLVELAQRRLRGISRAVADEEDVALSAFHSFCRAVSAGRFPDLHDRGDLWRLLFVLTERKAIDLVRYQTACKRNAGTSASARTSARVDTSPKTGECTDLAGVLGREPTPEFAALVADECAHLLSLLGDDQLRTLAVLKLEGFSNEEVAGRLGCAVRTVERKLRMIRTWWERESER